MPDPTFPRPSEAPTCSRCDQPATHEAVDADGRHLLCASDAEMFDEAEPLAPVAPLRPDLEAIREDIKKRMPDDIAESRFDDHRNIFDVYVNDGLPFWHMLEYEERERLTEIVREEEAKHAAHITTLLAEVARLTAILTSKVDGSRLTEERRHRERAERDARLLRVERDEARRQVIVADSAAIDAWGAWADHEGDLTLLPIEAQNVIAGLWWGLAAVTAERDAAITTGNEWQALAQEHDRIRREVVAENERLSKQIRIAGEVNEARVWLHEFDGPRPMDALRYAECPAHLRVALAAVDTREAEVQQLRAALDTP